MTPRRSLRTRLEDPVRGRRTPPFLSGFTLFDEPWRAEHTSSPFLFLGRTRSVPEALHCYNRPTLRSSFSSITITARSLSPKRDCTAYSNSTFRPLKMPDRPPSFMARSENKTLQAIAGTPVPPRHKTVVVTVTENREQHCASETPSSPQAPPVHEHSYTEEEDQTDSLKRPIFRSCAHLELLPSKLFRSTLYLDKSSQSLLGRLCIDPLCPFPLENHLLLRPLRNPKPWFKLKGPTVTGTWQTLALMEQKGCPSTWRMVQPSMAVPLKVILAPAPICSVPL